MVALEGNGEILKNKMRKYKTNNSIYDKYYTKKEISLKCIERTIEKIGDDIDIFIEPSAGEGSFSNQIKNMRLKCIALDKKPSGNNIIEMDFFSFNHNDFGILDENICCIGNPPFGRNSTIAIKFFNKASEFAKYISFIVPKTFRKYSIQSRLNRSFHLILDEDIPKNSFIFENKEVDVPCVLQIWMRKDNKRKIKKMPKKSFLFEFTDKNNGEFAVRRVGGNSGKVFLDIKNMSEVSNYFLKCIGCSKDELISIINNIDFFNIVNNTAGVKSLSMGELVYEVEKKWNLNKKKK